MDQWPGRPFEGADVLVEKGKIKAVGRGLTAPDGATLIDATGKHISPGIIDCHSHAATDGGINESGQTITAEVRVGDFVDPNDINIYRQVAGGVTSSNILHGSANTIGGQNQVLKFPLGRGPGRNEIRRRAARIKFALGENVKQSNWGAGASNRYPQSRMGVEQLVRDEFKAAQAYREGWDKGNRTKIGLPPRVDLELQAVAEILEGKRLIHCHSYRQDEILALLRTCEDYKVKIATLQHILEGYKVRRRHGPARHRRSSFSDWWIYKYEVVDAIPYNGALMHNAGVVVSFNSDDAELARRPEPRSGQGREVRRSLAGRSPEVRHAQSGQTTANRSIRWVARAWQGRRPGRLEHVAPVGLYALRARPGSMVAAISIARRSQAARRK